MKTKILCLLFVGCLLALVAWLVRAPTPVQADDVPKQYAETVSKGLEYLAKHQSDDGHWEGDDGQHPVAMTGLVGLALLMERNSPQMRRIPRAVAGGGPIPDAKYQANVRKAVDWLMSKSRPGRDGLIFSEHPSETSRYMQGHGVATLFLAGALMNESDQARRKKLAEVLAAAVNYIAKAQSSQGGWYRTSKAEGHDFDSIPDTVIQIQALQAAANAGVSVSFATLVDGQEYLKAALGKVETNAKAGVSAGRQAEIAGALACRSMPTVFQAVIDDELCKTWLKVCQTSIPVGRAMQFGRDELTHYYYAQAVFTLGGDTWNTYRSAMFDHLQKSQNKDGSWPSSAGISVGAIYSTAIWIIILQLDHESHPSRGQSLTDPVF